LSNQSFTKRQKERDRQEWQKDKLAKKEERRKTTLDKPVVPGEDPDIAGIVPGPQPVAEEV